MDYWKLNPEVEALLYEADEEVVWYVISKFSPGSKKGPYTGDASSICKNYLTAATKTFKKKNQQKEQGK